MKTRQEIDAWLKENYPYLINAEYMFGFDNNQDSVEQFRDDKLKVLVMFFSPGNRRAVSNTFASVNQLIHSKLGDDVFVDYCYYPRKEDLELLVDNDIPLLFGNVSHAPVQDYDLVCGSLSVMLEIYNIPRFHKYSNIPLGHYGRMDRKDIPLFALGGTSSYQAEILFGPLGNGDQSLFDLAYFGYGEGLLDVITKEMYQLKRSGTDLRRDKDKVLEFLRYQSEVKDYCYYPLAYETVYNEDKSRIKKISRKDPDAPHKVKLSKPNIDIAPGFSKKIFNLSGQNYYSQDFLISKGCTGFGHCTFCVQGSVAGPWREKPLCELKKDLDETKKYGSPNSVTPYSYNLNYYSRYLDLMKAAAERFSKITFINMRADVMAARPEYLELSKKLGLSRVSMGIEGMGDRIRNDILNKSLSREQLMKSFTEVFKQRMFLIKMGIILTGQETEADFNDWISEIEQAIHIRDKIGAKTALQMNTTPLIIYPHVPLRWLPRRTAELSWKGEKSMEPVTDQLRDMGLRVKFNNSGIGVFVDQFHLDAGRAGTEWFIEASLNQDLVYDKSIGGKGDMVKVKKAFDNVDIEPDIIFRERDVDEIFPADHISFVPERKIELWKEMHQKGSFRRQPCLKTPASLESSCAGCGECDTKEEVEFVTDRSLENENSVDDVIKALAKDRKTDSSRIVLKTSSDYKMYSRNALSHYISSLFLRNSDVLFDSYHSVGRNTSYWASKHGMKSWFGGTWAFDIYWKDRISKNDLIEPISVVNDKLESSEIITAYPNVMNNQISINNHVSYLGVLRGFSMSKVQRKFSTFDWRVRLASKHMGEGMTFERKHVPQIKDNILFVQMGDKIAVYMYLPTGINPHMVLSTMLRKRYRAMIDMFDVNTIDHVAETDVVCNCGNNLGYSYIFDEVRNRCPKCVGKVALKKFVEGS